ARVRRRRFPRRGRAGRNGMGSPYSSWRPHIAVTRAWLATISSGVPVGAQIAWLSNSSSGWPLEVTRVAAVTNCALTHGPFAAGGGGSAQPATSHGAGIVTLGWPLTVTRGFGAVACAWPPCEQSTLAPTWMRKPGIVHLLRRHQRAVVDRHRGTREHHGGALAVRDRDADVVDQDHRAGGALDQDAAGRPRHVADGDAVLQPRLQYQAGTDGIAGQRQRGHFRRAAPEAAAPDRVIRIALLKFHPHARADLRHHVHAALLAGERHAR